MSVNKFDMTSGGLYRMFMQKEYPKSGKCGIILSNYELNNMTMQNGDEDEIESEAEEDESENEE